MSPRTQKQFEEIREEKRELILNTALALFAKKGYYGTSVSIIAKSAKISKGLIYNYFISKEEILSKIIDLGLAKIYEPFNTNKAEDIEAEEMKVYIETIFASLKNNRRFWLLYFQVSMQADVQNMLTSRLEELISKIMQITVQFFKKQGYEDPQTEAIMFGALMDGIALDYVLQPDLIPLEKIKMNLINKYCTQHKK